MCLTKISSHAILVLIQDIKEVKKMADDIVPKSFWSFPSFRFPNFGDIDREDEWYTIPGISNGLTVSEDDNKVYVSAAVPGVDPDNIEMTFEKGYLWIKGDSVQEEGDGKKYYRKATGSFSYRVAVPGELDQSKEPEASYENGVMTVEFAKIPKAPPKKIILKSK
jgi:HSP20 family protein